LDITINRACSARKKPAITAGFFWVSIHSTNLTFTDQLKHPNASQLLLISMNFSSHAATPAANCVQCQ
jgi:hypothetical protein